MSDTKTHPALTVTAIICEQCRGPRAEEKAGVYLCDSCAGVEVDMDHRKENLLLWRRLLFAEAELHGIDQDQLLRMRDNLRMPHILANMLNRDECRALIEAVRRLPRPKGTQP